MKKLQVIQNKTLRYAYNERYPYTKNTKTLHEQAGIDPINFTLHARTEQIFTKMTNLQEENFLYLINNYERQRNHIWFQKTGIALHRGPPEKKYTIR